MAASSNIGKTCERILAIVQSAAPSVLKPERVKLGVVNTTDCDWLNTLAVDGPYAVIPIPKQTGTENHQKTKTFDIDLRIYWGYSANADFDYIALVDLCEAITPALLTFSSYLDKESIPYNSITWEKVDELNDQDPHVVVVEFHLEFSGNI
ncbi:MAG TPA: hypothetical protein VGP72_16535 [Planctomycetota bacterium]|jgi:hypothetical protein